MGIAGRNVMNLRHAEVLLLLESQCAEAAALAAESFSAKDKEKSVVGLHFLTKEDQQPLADDGSK